MNQIEKKKEEESEKRKESQREERIEDLRGSKTAHGGTAPDLVVQAGQASSVSGRWEKMVVRGG